VLDDLLGDLFDRDSRRREPGEQRERRGLRGFLGRLFNGGDDDDDRPPQGQRDGRRRRDHDERFDWD
jgi:hypothetical protein